MSQAIGDDKCGAGLWAEPRGHLTGAAVYPIDMNKAFEDFAFEDFVASRLTRYLAGQLIVHTQRSEWLDTDECVKIRPDVIFERQPGAVACIADSKYKITDDSYGIDADYYQMLAYTSAFDVPEGILIYCHHDGTAPPTDISVLNLGTQLSTWMIRLDRTPSHIEQELQELSAHIAQRAASAPI